jgi:hypothetical protein
MIKAPSATAASVAKFGIEYRLIIILDPLSKKTFQPNYIATRSQYFLGWGSVVLSSPTTTALFFSTFTACRTRKCYQVRWQKHFFVCFKIS